MPGGDGFRFGRRGVDYGRLCSYIHGAHSSVRETDTSLCGQNLRGPAWAGGTQGVQGLVSGRLPGAGYSWEENVFQAEGTACAKTSGQEGAWCLRGMERGQRADPGEGPGSPGPGE